MPINYFLQLIEYEKWANRRIVEYLEKHPGDQGSLSIFSHMVADIEVWLVLVGNEKVPENHASEPKWQLGQCKVKLNSAMNKLSQFLETLETQDLKTQIISFGLDENTYKNTVEEVLGHIFSHSQHHRGQIEVLMQEHSKKYTNLGYMYFLRNR